MVDFVKYALTYSSYSLFFGQSITIQCLEALQFLHGLGLIHCDLKPENILVKSYSRCEIKVIDLGSSCFETDHLCSYVQSRSYRAPEVILGLSYDKKIDVWSLGCILAELCTGNVSDSCFHFRWFFFPRLVEGKLVDVLNQALCMCSCLYYIFLFKFYFKSLSHHYKRACDEITKAEKKKKELICISLIILNIWNNMLSISVLGVRYIIVTTSLLFWCRCCSKMIRLQRYLHGS